MHCLKYVALLACLLQGVLCGPVTGTEDGAVVPAMRIDNPVDDYITMVLENLREKMITGIPQVGIPVLDPLSLGGIGLDIPPSPILDITGYFEDMTLTGLSDFEIDKVAADILSFTAKINLTFPALVLQGTYDLNGTALFEILPIFGEGEFILNLDDVDLYVAVVAADDPELGLQIDTLEVTLEAGSGSVVMGDLFGGGMMETALDIVLSTIFIDLVNEVSDRILSDVTEWLRTELNLALRGAELFAANVKLPQLLDTAANIKLPSKLAKILLN